MLKFHINLDKKRLFIAYILISLPFIIWDIWATKSGHWGFNHTYVLGIMPFGIALEEIAFFITVPFTMLVIAQVLAVRDHKKLSDNHVKIVRIVLQCSVLFAGALFIASGERGYTKMVVSVFAVMQTLFIVTAMRLYSMRYFWYFECILLVMFMLANTFLTALPVITYGDGQILGFRIGTIPLEDFFYNFALIHSFILVYAHHENRNLLAETHP